MYFICNSVRNGGRWKVCKVIYVPIPGWHNRHIMSYPLFSLVNAHSFNTQIPCYIGRRIPRFLNSQIGKNGSRFGVFSLPAS